MIEKYYSHGKLLLTSEYAVLKGTKALALPLNIGQSLQVSPITQNIIQWDTQEKGITVFTATFKIIELSILKSSDSEKANYILSLLKAAKKLQSQFLHNKNGFKITSNIEFSMQWGFGSSSTLINNIAQWANVNPFALNSLISIGSGYDIACAFSKTPIEYQLINGNPTINPVVFAPPFLDNLSLVYLNKKMATENNIKAFSKTKSADFNLTSERLSSLNFKFLNCDNLNHFIELLKDHERLISELIEQQPVKQKHFSDFNGEIKSLGAWGGDFILAASELTFEKQKKYFNNKGYAIVIPLKKLML